MVVLARQRRRFGNPDSSPYSSSRSDDGYHGNRAPPPSSRLFSQQTILLLIAGMGIGYVATVNMGHSPKNEIGLESIVKNLEQQRAATAAAASFPSGGDDNKRVLSSPMNMMQNSHTALLRGDGGSDVLHNHRSLSSSDNAVEVENAVSEDASKGGSAVSEHEDPVKAKNTFREKEEVEDLSEAQKRFVETQRLTGAQSIPTATTPHVMLTPTLPDSKRKKIIITGGAGFVGSHLTDKLMMEGHEVIVVDNFFTGQKKNIEHWLHHPRFTLVVHDVTEPIMLEVDEIYHLACPASPPHYQYNPVKTIKTSTMGTINMLGLAKRVKAKILLTSTSEIYGDPKVHPQPESYFGNVNTIGPRSCYDEGKRVAETMMYSYKNQNNVDVRVARIFNTFGPRMHPNDGRVVSNFIIQSLQDKPLTIYGDGGQTRSFQYVSDLVDGLHALMNGGYDMPVNLGNPDEYTVKHFAEYIKEITGSGSEISFLPATKDDPTQRKPDISTAKRELDWEPKVTVKEGLQKTIAYFSRVLEESGEIIPTGQAASRPKPKVE